MIPDDLKSGIFSRTFYVVLDIQISWKIQWPASTAPAFALHPQVVVVFVVVVVVVVGGGGGGGSLVAAFWGASAPWLSHLLRAAAFGAAPPHRGSHRARRRPADTGRGCAKSGEWSGGRAAGTANGDGSIRGVGVEYLIGQHLWCSGWGQRVFFPFEGFCSWWVWISEGKRFFRMVWLEENELELRHKEVADLLYATPLGLTDWDIKLLLTTATEFETGRLIMGAIRVNCNKSSLVSLAKISDSFSISALRLSSLVFPLRQTPSMFTRGIPMQNQI